MLKSDIIPALIKISPRGTMDNAKIVWYLRGTGHTFANVKLSNGSMIEVIFDCLGRLSLCSEHWNAATTPQIEIEPPQQNQEINIEDLPF